jgi:hypothetical protein
MPLYELSMDKIGALERADFASEGLRERSDLQRLLRDNIDVIAPDLLVISEEFSSWDKSDRRIDLLAVDRQARLIVVELKRTKDDSLADLQAIRYAALVSQMTFDEAVETYKAYLAKRGRTEDAEKSLLSFFGWSEPTGARFGEDVRIVLAAADFSPEVTSTALWLNERDLDIRCVRMQPYRLGASLILDVQQIIPLPEVGPYQVKFRQKQREVRAAAGEGSDWTRYDVTTDEGVQEALYKREVVFAAVRQLLRRGNTPARIEEAAGRHIFEVMEGDVDEESFRAELAKRRNDPNSYKRFFFRNDQLFRADGKTYTLTNQWGKTSMEALLAALTARFGDYGFEIRPSE